MPRKHNGITAMLMMHIVAFGITLVVMKSLMVKRIHFLLKLVTLSCAITWLAWQELLDVSLAALMHLSVPFVFLCIRSIAGNFTNVGSLLILLMSRISFDPHF